MTIEVPTHRLRRGLITALLASVLAPGAFAAATSSSTFTAAATPPLHLNEVMAANTRIANAGTFPDLIELHNAGATAIDLGGKSLTDDPALPRKFVFPAGTSIPAGGYLTIYADTATTAPGLHTGFALDAEGDLVQLYDSGAGTPADEIRFGFQIPDLSIARTGSAANVWALTAPTPGAANGTPLALGSVAGVKLNEWAGKIVFRLDHDMIELFNPAAQPAAIGGVRLTDNVSQPAKFTFPPLSFVAASGFLPLYGADFVFGLDGDRETVTLFGDNTEQIDQITLQSQPNDRSSGRSPDGTATILDFAIPSPGLSNATPFPAAYQDLLANLRITELMYDPVADNNASQFEFVELQNIGATTLNLAGVRFTNGLEYEFPAGSTLAPGAFVVVVNDRSSFRSRYPQVSDAMIAPGGFNGSLANDGETIALTLPSPWRVHILRFRFEPSWHSSTSRGGYSLVPVAPLTAAPTDWQQRNGWRPSAAVNGSPGAADPGTPGGGGGGTSAARLANLSVRTAMDAGQTLIVGTTVSGGASNLLVRAAGPALAAFGLGSAMADPRLELYNGATLAFENDNWTADLAATFNTVGAFAFVAGSRDAAFVRSIQGGPTIQVRGSGPGVVLVEVYDLGTGNPARLVNVSARNRVGTDDNILIAGFNVAGTGQKRLLLRAVGPKLGTFGVTGFLADPRLELYNGTTKIGENDNWTADLAATFATVGAFALDAGSRDAALVTTLNPGTYTVQVSGVGGGTGEGLVEIYELP